MAEETLIPVRKIRDTYLDWNNKHTTKAAYDKYQASLKPAKKKTAAKPAAKKPAAKKPAAEK